MPPLPGRFELDTTTHLQLQLHLINSYHLLKDPCLQPVPLELGTLEQLRIATTISKLTAFITHSVLDVCDQSNLPLFRLLALQQYALVACVRSGLATRVTAVYSLQQIHALEKRYTTPAHDLRWCILKIPRMVKSHLLKTVHLEEGLIITSQKALEDWNNHLPARL